MRQKNLFDYELVYREPEMRLTEDGVESAMEFALVRLQQENHVLFEDMARAKMELPVDRQLSLDEMKDLVEQVDALTNSRQELIRKLKMTFPLICTVVHIGDGIYQTALDSGGTKPDGISISVENAIHAQKRQAAMATGQLKSVVKNIGIARGATAQSLSDKCDELTEAVRQITT